MSAAFNPVVTLVERALGLIDTRDAVPDGGAQVAGGFLGVVVANLMFDLDAVTIVDPRAQRRRAVAGRGRGHPRPGDRDLRQPALSGRTETIAFAVGGYITAAYWFTSSTSFANPAVTVARMFSDTFAGIAPASVPMFIVMQLVGGVLALGLVRVLYPRTSVRATADASSTEG